MNLLDFEYLKNNMNTAGFFGSDSSLANLFLLQNKYNTELKIKNDVLLRYYYGDENRTGYGFPIPIKPASLSQDWLVSAMNTIIEDAREQNRPVSFCLLTQEQKNQLDSCIAASFPEFHPDWKTNRDDTESEWMDFCPCGYIGRRGYRYPSRERREMVPTHEYG